MCSTCNRLETGGGIAHLVAVQHEGAVNTTQRVEKKRPATLRGQQTRKVLLQAAEEVFRRRGYGRASVGEIVDRAGVATGTFYVHFENKESLYLEVVEELARRLETWVAERVASHGTRLSRQRAALEAFFEFVKQNPHLYRLVRQTEDIDEVVYRGFYQRIARAQANGLTDAMQHGEVSRFDPEVLAYVLMGVAHFVGMRFVEWEAEPKGVPETLLDEVAAFVEAGLTAPRQPRPHAPAAPRAVEPAPEPEGYSFFR